MDALMRFVGDLLRARAGTETTGRIYRPTGKGDFSDAPVRYDMFMRVLERPWASLSIVRAALVTWRPASLPE